VFKTWFVFWHFLVCLGRFSKNWAIFSKLSGHPVSIQVMCLQARLRGPQGRDPALPANTRLGWKWLIVTNTLAYAELITAVKKVLKS
jgi:hypothetical protein